MRRLSGIVTDFTYNKSIGFSPAKGQQHPYMKTRRGLERGVSGLASLAQVLVVHFTTGKSLKSFKL
jgi:hypothetical protein